jgi:hypothetical protein
VNGVVKRGIRESGILEACDELVIVIQGSFRYRTDSDAAKMEEIRGATPSPRNALPRRT